MRVQQTDFYFGSKACGPTGFVAYSLLNTTEFLDKVKTQIIRKNSMKWGYFACDVSPSQQYRMCEW
jgi:hypothetical protein